MRLWDTSAGPRLGAALILASAGLAGAETVTVYSPHGQELLTDCQTRFEEAHPEHRVRWLDMGSQEILDRLRAESRRPRADVWFGAPATLFMQAGDEGLLAPYRPSWFAATDSSARDRLDRWYGSFLTPEVILYNNERVAAAEVPRSFMQLLDERYADRIVLREPMASGTMRTIFASLVMSAPNETEGLRRLARLDALTRSYVANPTLLFVNLARGGGELSVWNLPDAMLQIERYGFPFGYVLPEDGTPVLIDAIAIVSGSEHPEAARAFYEFVSSPELAAHMAHAYYRIPARRDLDPASLPEWMRAPMNILPMDWERLAREGPRWMNHFDSRIKGRGERYLAEER